MFCECYLTQVPAQAVAVELSDAPQGTRFDPYGSSMVHHCPVCHTTSFLSLPHVFLSVCWDFTVSLFTFCLDFHVLLAILGPSPNFSWMLILHDTGIAFFATLHTFIPHSGVPEFAELDPVFDTASLRCFPSAVWAFI